MQISAVKTPLIKPGDDLIAVIVSSLKKEYGEIKENTVLTVASKIVSTVENRVVPKKTGTREEKYDLVRQEADLYLEPHSSKYGLMLTIKNNWMFMFAGIDESNVEGESFLLWPKNPQASAVHLWKELRKNLGLQNLGIILTDSSSIPLNWGVTGHAIAFAGFEPLYDYRGTQDLHGRTMKFEQMSIVQSLAATGALAMGEGDESTPLAVITDIPKISFLDRELTQQEMDALKVELADDAYAPLLLAADWQTDKTPYHQALRQSQQHSMNSRGLKAHSLPLFQVAQEMGLEPSWETEYGVFSLMHNGRKRTFFQTKSPLNSAAAVYQVTNKHVARLCLGHFGFSEFNIPFLLPKTKEELADFFEEHQPIIAKPISSLKSKAVFKVEFAQQLEMIPFQSFFYERFIDGIEYRCLLLNHEVVAVQQKELIEPNNFMYLKRTNLKPSQLDQSLLDLSVKLSKAFRLRYVAVDFMVEKKTGKQFVLEINSSPGILTLVGSQSQGVSFPDLPKKIMEAWLAE